MPSNWKTIFVIGVVLLAGCTGVGGSETPVTPNDPMTTAEPTTETAETTVETAATATDDSPGYGTEFVSVSPLENQSRHTEWPDNRSVHFENMTASRQAVFEDALDGQVEFGPEEENPFGFHDESRPEVVRYEGTWYFVRVAIV